MLSYTLNLCKEKTSTTLSLYPKLHAFFNVNVLCAVMPLLACAWLQHNETAGVVTVVSSQKWTSKNRSHAGSVTVLHKVTTLKGRLAKFKLDMIFAFYEQGYRTFTGVTYL